MKSTTISLAITALVLLISTFLHPASYACVVIKRAPIVATAFLKDKDIVVKETRRHTATRNYGSFDVQKGATDANRYYQRWNNVKWITTAVTFFTGGIVGLIVAIAASTTTPKESNLGYPDSSLMKNPNYHMGYIKQARRIKARKVWGGFGIGLILLAAFFIYLATL